MDLAPDLSTVIDTDPRPSEGGGGQAPLADASPQPPEVKAPRPPREDLEHVFKADAKKAAEEKKDAEPANAAEEAKPAPEAKADDKAAEKPAEGVKAEESKTEEAPAKPEAKEERDQRRIEPPARFQADAKEHFRNTPRTVQREVETMARDLDTYQKSHERYETIRDIDELAKSNGRELRDTLVQVHQFENMMRTNPIAALNMALQQVGPRKADGSSLSLFEVAQHIVNQGQQGYQQSITQAHQQAQATQQQQQTIQQQQAAAAKAASDKAINDYVVEPFRAANPRYDELLPAIAYFLEHGNIDRNLSVPERLKAAYDMADRVNPASHAQPEAQDSPDPARRADDGLSGSKSIKSAHGSVSEDVEDDAKDGESTRDSILKEMRRLSAR